MPNIIDESIDSRKGKRQYGNAGTQKKSTKKQGISADHGWNSRMRTKFYHMSQNMNDIILKDDMTDKTKRPEGLKKTDVRTKKNHAPKFWSDNHLDRSKATYENFLKFIVERDEERRKTGFYEQNPNVKEVKELKHINHHDIRDYIDHKLYDGSCTPSTVRTYLGHIQKVSESTHRHGIDSHKEIVKDYLNDMIPSKNKDYFVRGRGATDGKKGYTMQQANKIIDAMAHDPYAQTGAIVLTDVGVRKDTFFKLRWSDVLDDNNNVKSDYIDLSRPGLMKGGREQIAEVSERATQALSELWETGKFNRDEEIFGSRFSEYKYTKVLKEACENAGVDYKAYHEFRGATVEMFDQKAAAMTKEELVDRIMKYVDTEVPHRETGELYKPHNPIVLKKVPKMKEKLDSKGETVLKKDGTPVMIPDRRKDKNGNWYTPMVTKLDETGHPVYAEKWSKEELMNSRIDYLRNVYTAEQISHNRPDANSPYRHG